MIRYSAVGFDALRLASVAEYIPPSKVLDPEIQLPHHQKLTDSPDDFLVVKNALFAPRAGIIVGDAWCADAIHYMPGNWPTVDWLPGPLETVGDSRYISLEPPKKIDRLEGEYFFIDSGVGARNFGHFVHDTLPYGWLYKRLLSIRPRAIPILLGRPIYQNQRDLFATVFGRPVDQCLIAWEWLQVETLILARRQTYFDGPEWRSSFSGFRFARERAYDMCLPMQKSGGRYFDFYLARLPSAVQLRKEITPVQGRNFTNLDALWHGLIERGFMTFEPAFVRLPQIVNALALARKIIALHGAGLANLLFCPPETRVFEIRSHLGNWRSLEALAAILGQDFIPLSQSVPDDPDNPRLDVEAILESLA